MIQQRFGIGLIVLAAAWVMMLPLTNPGKHAEPDVRNLLFGVAILLVVVAVLPRHLNLSGTVLTFIALGMCLHLLFFGLFRMSFRSAIPVLLVVGAIWCWRRWFDNDAVVVVSAAAACGLAIVQPEVLITVLLVLLVINLGIWLMNAIGSLRASR